MLSYDIRSLEAQPQQVDGYLESSDPRWDADDMRPIEPGVHVTGRLSAAGRGRFYFSGAIQGTALGGCRRCLVDVTSAVQEEVHLIFAQSGLDEADEDDVVEVPPNARELDLGPAIREEWLLAVPQFALCREDCQGLCPSCGADRNTGACTCAPNIDPRWAALRSETATRSSAHDA